MLPGRDSHSYSSCHDNPGRRWSDTAGPSSQQLEPCLNEYSPQQCRPTHNRRPAGATPLTSPNLKSSRQDRGSNYSMLGRYC